MNWNSFYHFFRYFRYVKIENDSVAPNMGTQETKLITVLDFIAKLRMTEEEARELEDDRVSFYNHEEIKWMWTDKRMSIEIQDGFKATLNDDGTEVTLHKRD